MFNSWDGINQKEFVYLNSNEYGKSFGIVNWHGTFPYKFSLSAGMRQGRCLFPISFSIHMNVLIEKILQTDLGCHFNLINFGIVMYADDLITVSSSISQSAENGRYKR